MEASEAPAADQDSGDDARAFSRLVRRRAEELHISFEGVGKRIGLARSSWYRSADESRPLTGEQMRRLAAVLELPLRDLVRAYERQHGPAGMPVSDIGTDAYRPEGHNGSATNLGWPDEGWSPNPALRGAWPPRVLAVADGYLRRLAAAGVAAEQVEEIERLMLDDRYAKLNKRMGKAMSEDDMIVLIEATWSATREVMSWQGVRV